MEEILSTGFEKSRLQSSSWIANRRRSGCFHLVLRKKACILLWKYLQIIEFNEINL